MNTSTFAISRFQSCASAEGRADARALRKNLREDPVTLSWLQPALVKSVAARVVPAAVLRVYALIVSRTADRICKPRSRFRCRYDLNKSTLFQKSAWNHALSRSSKFRKLRHAIRPSRFHLALYSELCLSRFVRLCYIVGGACSLCPPCSVAILI